MPSRASRPVPIGWYRRCWLLSVVGAVWRVGSSFFFLFFFWSSPNFFGDAGFGFRRGFGIFASIELMLVSIVMHFGDGPAAILSLVKSAAYNGVTLLWIMYLRRQSEPVLEIDMVPQLSALNASLAVSTQAGDIGFLSMVEQAVDRVLSRGSWPRPSVKGSQIIGHKPEREERN